MEQKQLNLQTVNNRGINIMEDVVMKGHQDAVNRVFGFSLKDGVKRRREDTPLVMQGGEELYENRLNRDVYDELQAVQELLRMARSVIWKHQTHNYQSTLSGHLHDIGNRLNVTISDFAAVIDEIDEDYKKDAGLFLTVDELEQRQQGGDPDAAYDEYREREGENHA
jgi:hypothetical protein